MGACLSCLSGSSNDIADDENTSLLSNDKVKYLEDELLTELRNKQLNTILNSTNDHLIDISNFKSLSNVAKPDDNHSNTNNNNEIDNDLDNDEISNDLDEIFKIIPIPKLVIKSEINDQLSLWNSKNGAQNVNKALQINLPDNLKNEKFIIDFV